MIAQLGEYSKALIVQEDSAEVDCSSATTLNTKLNAFKLVIGYKFSETKIRNFITAKSVPRIFLHIVNVFHFSTVKICSEFSKYIKKEKELPKDWMLRRLGMVMKRNGVIRD